MFTFRPGRQANGAKNGNGGYGNGHNSHNGHNGNGHHAVIDSVIGPGIHWKGALTGAGGVRVEGSFDGSIRINGALVIAEGAKVTADEVRASAVSVAGTVKANIVADKVEILSTGRIYGDLSTRTFASEEGAFLRGQIVMQDETPEPASQPAEPAGEQAH